MLKVKVIEKSTQDVLWESDMTKLEEAYKYAAKLEEIGLDVDVIAPTTTDTLIESLKLSGEGKEKYQKILSDESLSSSCITSNSCSYKENKKD